MKYILNFVAVTLSLVLVTAHAADLSAEDEWRIKAEIKQLVDKYAMSRDNLDAEGYAGVFAEDGTLHLFGESYTGPDEILSLSENWDVDSVGMHIMSTSQITIVDESNATGIHYSTVYGAVPPESHAAGGLIEISAPVIQGKYTDAYRLTDEGWKIAERRFQPVYSFFQILP
jgi:hypothetical protein